MQRKVTAFLVALLIAQLGAFPAQAAQYGYCAYSSVPVYDKPNGKVVLRLDYGQKVVASSNGKSGWVKVACKAGVGYAKAAKFVQGKYTGIVERKGSCSYFDVVAVDKCYRRVNSSVRRAFEDDGWRIVCVGSELTFRYDGAVKAGSQVYGLTKYSARVILVRRDYTVVHELGHWLDWKLGGVANSSEFKKIYKKECKRLVRSSEYEVSDSNVSSSTEYFAESYYLMYFTKNFAEVCPETYLFLRKCEKLV